MSEISFETALDTRVDEMLDACTRCGKCVEVCPSVAPAGIMDVSAGDIIGGILDLVRTGEGPDAFCSGGDQRVRVPGKGADSAEVAGGSGEGIRSTFAAAEGGAAVAGAVRGDRTRPLEAFAGVRQ